MLTLNDNNVKRTRAIISVYIADSVYNLVLPNPELGTGFVRSAPRPGNADIVIRCGRIPCDGGGVFTGRFDVPQDVPGAVCESRRLIVWYQNNQIEKGKSLVLSLYQPNFAASIICEISQK